MGKVTKVRLVVPAENMESEFDIDHAERLLAMHNNGGWTLPPDTDFEYNENGIKRKRNKGTSSETNE